MNNAARSRFALSEGRLFAFVAGASLLLIGGAGLWAWQFSVTALIQIHPLFAATHYNLALGLTVLGLGLLAHGFRLQAATIVCGLLVSAGGFVTWADWFFRWNLGLETWWLSPPAAVVFAPCGGISATLVLCLTLAGICLVLMPLAKSFSWSPFAIALSGVTLVILTFAGYLGYSLGPTLSQNVRPSIQGIIALGLVGAFLLKWALWQQQLRASRASWLPMLVGLSCITATLILWQALSVKETQRVDEMVQLETVHLQRRLQEELPARLKPVVAMASKLAANTRTKSKTQEDDGGLGFESPGNLGVAWLKENQQLVWLITTPVTSKAARSPKDHSESLPDLVAGARERGETTMYLAPRSWWGLRTAVFYVPLHPGRKTDGGLVAVFRLRDLFDSLLHFNVSPGYALSLRDGEETIFTRFGNDTTYQSSLSKVQRVRVLGRDWQLQVWPTHDVLATQSFSFAKFALLFGLLTTLLLAASVHLAQTARRRAGALEKEVRERTEAEQALRQSEAKYRSLFENLDQGVFLKDYQGRYLAVNQPFCLSLGSRERDVLNKTDFDLLPKPLAEQYQAEELLVLIHGHKIEREATLTIEGKSRFIRRILTSVRDHQGRVTGVLGICWDVTEQRNLESHLRQSQKMEAVGQLAGGIAHDFNNLLTVILGNLDLMALRMQLPEAAMEVIQSAQKAGRRASALTNQLLGFSRQRQLLWQPTDLNGLIDEVVTLLSRTIDPRIQIVAKKSENPWLVHGDPSQLNQVLMNLCLNARDAIPGYGQITIETAWLELDKAAAARHYEARPGEFVRLRVSDTGQGMTSETRARLFEPFFTTKEVGKGTGLGLAMVFGIVKQHQGWIECHSEIGRGTRFDIYLPRAAAEMTEKSGIVPRPQIAKDGHETILVVDDEPLIRKLVTTVLQSHGYGALEAEDGIQAVEIFRAERKKIDLVLLDLTMPKLSGQETFRQLLQIDPKVAVVLASGYTSESVTSEEMQLIYGFAKKPFSTGELLHTLRGALDQVRSGKKPKQQVACAV